MCRVALLAAFFFRAGPERGPIKDATWNANYCSAEGDARPPAGAVAKPD